MLDIEVRPPPHHLLPSSSFARFMRTHRPRNSEMCDRQRGLRCCSVLVLVMIVVLTKEMSVLFRCCLLQPEAYQSCE